MNVSPVALGAWALGGWRWGGKEKNRPEDTVRASIDAGINLIDTAPVYGFGFSEEVVGQAIQGHRDKVLIATKCGIVWDDRPGAEKHFDTFDNDGNPVSLCRCLRKESVFQECDDSLKRLGIDVIDIYQCHWPDPNTPVEETIDALITLQDKGKIREYGVSNFTADQMEECLKYGVIASDQPKYSLLTRDIEDEILPFCIENDIGIIAYSPMENGLLTGKITVDQEFPDGDLRNDKPWFKPENRQNAITALNKIRPVAEKYNATLGQIALAWVFSQPGITSAIAGARNGEQAKSNAQAARILLEDKDIEEIKKIFEFVSLNQA
ncbi:aldo/keto reductase [Verrucomicrobiota bacterium]